MKRKILTLTLLISLSATTLYSQDKMYIHKSDGMTLGALVSSVDSMWFSSDGLSLWFRLTDTLFQYPVDVIDSITFGNNSNTITVTYNGNKTTILNPLAFEGVSVTADQARVTVNATTLVQDINFKLQGTTSNGHFKIYTAKRYNLILNGVTITNPTGPAINVQTDKKTTVNLTAGSVNTLTDGTVYAVPPGTEDQDGAFFSEAKLVFTGTGTLVINGHGNDQHGLCTDDALEITSGVITVNSAVKDGIHANDGVKISGGTINVASTGDGIDGDEGYVIISGGNITTVNNSDDVDGISCDSTMTISGGTINVTIGGDQSKGLKSGQLMTLSGGTITIHNSGDAILESSGSGYDPSYCTAIKSDNNISISGAQITIITSGLAGRAISSDADVLISSGIVSITNSGNGATYTNASGHPDAYVATCFSSDGDIMITGGSVTTTSSGSAGKGISSNAQLQIGSSSTSPTISVTTTGAKILISGSGPSAEYAEAKAIRSDSAITILNGTITISSADDGIKSGTSITFNTANLTINNSYEGLEAPFITINSGNLHVTASNDGINSSFGNDVEYDDGSLLTISGGYVVVNGNPGDGIDSNGDVLVTGGTVIVHGPTNAPEVGLDYNGNCNVNGGFMVISGSNSNMTQAPQSTSLQHSLKVMINAGLSSTTLFHIRTSTGTNILTFQPMRKYYSIVFSSSALVTGGVYSIYTGGSCTGGTVTDGLYNGGTYSGGTLRSTFTIVNMITNVNF